MFCRLKKSTFADYSYVSCVWSGDQLPVCPHCGQSPHEKSFTEFHSQEDESKGGAE